MTKMKTIAYMITAYLSPESLLNLVTALDNDGADFYIHIDRKKDAAPFLSLLSRIENVYFLPDEKRVKVYWGGYSQIEMQYNLIKTILNSGVTYSRVGAATETEMKEAKLRMEDALNATRAAVEEGIIAGGGSAYIHAEKEVDKLIKNLEGDEKTGAKVVLKALEAPLYHIAANAGLEGAVIINKVRDSKNGVGFNALTEEYVDMVKTGILDPLKVTRSALQNATSVAATFLTTESVVATKKEPTPPAPAAPAPGMY